MSSGAISVKVVPWNGKLPAFKQQFPAFIQQSGHISGLKYKVLPGVTVTDFHDQDGIAKSTPNSGQLDPEDLTEEERMFKNFRSLSIGTRFRQSHLAV